MPGSRDEWSRRTFLKRAGTAAAATRLCAGISPLLDGCGNPATTSKGPSSVVNGGHLVEGVPSDPTRLNGVMDTDLAAALEGKVPYVYLVDDALAPRGLREATYEGHRFARIIGEPDMPASVSEALFDPIEAQRSAALA